MAKSQARFQSISTLGGAKANLRHNLGSDKREQLTNIHEDMTKHNLYNINGEWIDSKELSKLGDDPKQIITDKFVKSLEPYKEQFEKSQEKHRGKNKITFTEHINKESKNRTIMSDCYIGMSAEAYRDMGFMKYHYVDNETGKRISEQDYQKMDEDNRDKITTRITDYIEPNKDKWMDYVKAQEKMFKTNYKKAYGVKPNILAMELHLDETTPHIHVQTSYIKYDTNHMNGKVSMPYFFKNDNANDVKTSNFQDLMEKSQRVYAEPKGAKIVDRTKKIKTIKREQGWMNDKTYAVDKKINKRLQTANNRLSLANAVADYAEGQLNEIEATPKSQLENTAFRASVYNNDKDTFNKAIKDAEYASQQAHEKREREALKKFKELQIADEKDDPKEQ